MMAAASPRRDPPLFCPAPSRGYALPRLVPLQRPCADYTVYAHLVLGAAAYSTATYGPSGADA